MGFSFSATPVSATPNKMKQTETDHCTEANTCWKCKVAKFCRGLSVWDFGFCLEYFSVGYLQRMQLIPPAPLVGQGSLPRYSAKGPFRHPTKIPTFNIPVL